MKEALNNIHFHLRAIYQGVFFFSIDPTPSVWFPLPLLASCRVANRSPQMKAIHSLLLPLSVLTSSWAYTISENIVGQDFYNSFDWFTQADPNLGRV